MSLRWLDRLSTFLRADAHGVLDVLEDRALLLRQHLRDAERAADEERARLDALACEEERLGEALRRRGEAVGSLDADVERALAAGEEELARFAVGRLLPERRAAAELEARRGLVHAEREKRSARLEEREGRLGELRDRARTEWARARRTRSEDEPFPGAPVAAEEIELELLRRRGGEAS